MSGNVTNHRHYDKYKRNKEAKKFYDSTAWKRCRQLALLRDGYLCQECRKQGLITPADMVHHIQDREDHPELALTLDNLVSLCNPCHNKEHPEKGGGRKKRKRNANVVTFKSNPEIV